MGIELREQPVAPVRLSERTYPEVPREARGRIRRPPGSTRTGGAGGGGTPRSPLVRASGLPGVPTTAVQVSVVADHRRELRDTPPVVGAGCRTTDADRRGGRIATSRRDGVPTTPTATATVSMMQGQAPPAPLCPHRRTLPASTGRWPVLGRLGAWTASIPRRAIALGGDRPGPGPGEDDLHRRHHQDDGGHHPLAPPTSSKKA